MSNNTNVTLRSTVNSTLSIKGATATTNLDVPAGSTLQIGEASAGTSMTLNYGAITGQLANIAGDMIINNLGVYTNTNSTTTFAMGGEFKINRDGGSVPLELLPQQL